MSARFALAALSIACIAYAADDTPGWLKDLAGASLPQYGAKVNAVVLFNEEHTTLGDSGKLTTTTHSAIKILTRQGAEPVFFDEYDTASGKVRDFRAWMIAPSGKVKKYGKDEILDVACVENDVYNQCRRRLVSGKRDAEAGSVFGYESTVDRQSFSNQLLFHFQESSPVRLARFQVTAPSGWEVKTASFNGAPREAAPAGGTYTWQMENLPAIEREAAGPGFLSVVPWVGVTLLGDTGAKTVSSWPQAAKLLAELNEGQAEPNEAMIAKAKSLTEGATSELEKIRALGRFAQHVNYVSIQVNVSRGGGYRPHEAAQVFQKLYGDCKDKANLMRALLKAIGMTAYPVAIYSGDRTHVSAEWPSLGAFNHAISAIRVGPETNVPAVLDHPKMGRLLFFDSTDPYVPAGYLPDHEQASLALVGAGEMGDLVRVPSGTAIATARQRNVDAVLKPDGSIEGSFVEKRTGEELASAVSEYRGSSKTDYIKMVERWVGRSVPGSNTSGIEVVDGNGEFVLKGKFVSERYAQRPQPRMLIFRSAPLRHGELMLTAKTRKYPVVLDADAIEETVRISLPADFKVDELPEPMHLASPFGKFDATWAADGGAFVFQRKLEMQAQSVPVNQYEELKRFLDTVMGSAEAPVVLVK
ncbi:MAG TPA: DUF3857 domain-containing protein [Bryobacteraceae bacterium]|nr:DUF3857 domain-containing protein [Bryobacteraceae bacterium]